MRLKAFFTAFEEISSGEKKIIIIVKKRTQDLSSYHITRLTLSISLKLLSIFTKGQIRKKSGYCGKE